MTFCVRSNLLDAFLMKFSKESLLWAKSYFEACLNSAIYDSEVFTKFRKTSCLTSYCQHEIETPVSRLLSPSRPFAVFWFIISIIVNSFDCKSRRFVTHVLEKVLKLKPSLAHLNSSAAIIFEALIAWIVATPHHVAPNPVRTCLLASFGLAVLCRSGGTYFPYETSARPSGTASELHIANWCLFSTVTNAKTHSITAFLASNRRQVRDYQKSSKPFADEGMFIRHSNVSSLFCLAARNWRQPVPGCDYIPAYAVATTRIGGHHG